MKVDDKYYYLSLHLSTQQAIMDFPYWLYKANCLLSFLKWNQKILVDVLKTSYP